MFLLLLLFCVLTNFGLIYFRREIVCVRVGKWFCLWQEQISIQLNILQMKTLFGICFVWCSQHINNCPKNAFLNCKNSETPLSGPPTVVVGTLNGPVHLEKYFTIRSCHRRTMHISKLLNKIKKICGQLTWKGWWRKGPRQNS